MSKKLYQALAKVQADLKAPKNQRNAFGKYNYRSKEDILEAAKPLCNANGLCLTITDELQLIGERYYIKSTATVTEVTEGVAHSVTGYAREAENKKGMDESQITGAASSYAGKYALNNLFGIDDTKDADATNTHGTGEKPAVAKRTAAVKKAAPAATPAVETKAPAKAAPRKAAPAKKADPAKKPADAPAPKVDAPTGAKTSGKANAKKALTVEQRDNFLKGVEQGKFDLVEKHLKNYAVDAKSKAVTAALNKAKGGK